MSVVYGATKERGRRFEWVFTPHGTAAERKEWASIRADAWRLFEAKRYQEAEPIFRRVLELKPSDYGAQHDLGVTLMELDRCEEGLPILEKVLEMTVKDEPLADTFFQIGVCKAKLGRWSEALDHFEILYDAAVDFEKRTKNVWVMPGTRVLNREVLGEWKEKARQHIPQAELQHRAEGGVVAEHQCLHAATRRILVHRSRVGRPTAVAEEVVELACPAHVLITAEGVVGGVVGLKIGEGDRRNK